MSSRPYVVYWNRIAAPYNRDRFNAVAQRGGIDFEAWFSARTEADRHWAVDETTWKFRHSFLPALHLHSGSLPIPSQLLKGRIPDLLVSLYDEPSFLFGWWLARHRGSRTAFWAERTFDTWIRRRRWKESLKRAVFPHVDGFLTIGEDGRQFIVKYGGASERVHFVTNTIDIARLRHQVATARLRRRAIRSSLGLHGLTFLYVGRIWSGKGLDLLVDAFNEFKLRFREDSTLLLVGEGPDRVRLETRVRDLGIRNVVFTGFAAEDRVFEMYGLADIFVFPSLGDPYGLVVDEAMAASLPVICSSACGEIRTRIRDGVNGFIVQPEVGQLSARMLKLALDCRLRSQMGEQAATSLASHSHDLWALEFETVVGRILAAPRAT